jgi:hypothetical protein
MSTSPAMQTLILVAGYTICLLIGLLGLVVLWKIVDGSIDISELLEEANGGASMSRFQWLIFTFVFAFSLFLVVVSTNPPSFPNIPGTVLSLLGISGSSFLVSKGIQFSDPAGLRATDIVISPAKATVSVGKTQQFTAETADPKARLVWEKVAGDGTLDANGLYTAPATITGGHAYATIQVSSPDFPGATDLAVVTIVS